MNKYGAIKTAVDGIMFDSRAEARRYAELKLLEMAGEITDLKCHPQFELQPSFKHEGKTIRSINYTADFSYMENGKLVVEDVKGGKATLTAAFQLRRRLLLYKYQAIELRIVS